MSRRDERLLARIADVCADIDVWRDEWPGTTLSIVRPRLGDSPTTQELQAEYGRLLRLANRHGVIEEEEEVVH